MRRANAVPRLLIVSLALALLAPAPSLAQFSGYYLEFSGGHAQSEVELIPPFSNTSTASAMEADSGIYQLALGIRFNDTFAVEVGYGDYGSYSGSGALWDRDVHWEVDPVTEEATQHPVDVSLSAEGEYQLQGYSASVLAHYPLARRTTVYGELGLMAWTAESELNGEIVERGGIERRRRFKGNFSQSGSSFFYSAGLLHRFNLSYGLHLEYQQFSFDADIFSSRGDLSNVNLGLRLYF